LIDLFLFNRRGYTPDVATTSWRAERERIARGAERLSRREFCNRNPKQHARDIAALLYTR
jgi:hypothetical protein